MGIEAIIILFALYYCITNAIVETKHAAAGTTSPRMQMKMERLKAEGQPGGTTPRYGTKAWFADLWSDSLAKSTEKRRAKASTAKSADLDTATDEALELVKTDRHMGIRKLEEVEGDPLRALCIKCGVEVASSPEVNGISFCEKCYYEPPRPPREEIPSMPDNVIPMFKTPVAQGEDMSEVLGLVPAIHYAKATATAHNAHSTAGNEQLIGYLQGAEVSGATLTSVQEAQAASANAGQLWAKAAEMLEKQMSVKEAYDNNTDAGNKAFLQGGQ